MFALHKKFPKSSQRYWINFHIAQGWQVLEFLKLRELSTNSQPLLLLLEI